MIRGPKHLVLLCVLGAFVACNAQFRFEEPDLSSSGDGGADALADTAAPLDVPRDAPTGSDAQLVPDAPDDALPDVLAADAAEDDAGVLLVDASTEVDAANDAADAALVTLPCGADAHCALGTLHCELPVGKCVECLVNAHCGGARPFCEVGHLCAECHVNEDCGPMRVCEPRGHICVDSCAGTGICPRPDQACDEPRGRCTECVNDAHCVASASGPLCEKGSGRCVRCRGNPDCPAPTPACDARTGQCVQCLDTNWCKSTPGSVCDPGLLMCLVP